MTALREINHGPASLDATIQAAEIIGNTLYVVSRNVRPARLGVFDLETQDLVGHHELPDGTGGSHAAITSSGSELYFSTFRSRNLYHFDTETSSLEIIREVPGSSEAPPFALTAADDGTVFIGTRDAELFSYQPDRDEFDKLTSIPNDLPVVRIESHEGTVFTSAGPPAVCFAIDAESGAADAISVPELDDERILKWIDVSEDWLVLGSTPSALVTIIDRTNFDQYRLILPEPETGKTIQGLRIVGDAAYFHVLTFTDRGRQIPLYRLDLETESITNLCTLPGRTNPVGLFYRDRPLVIPKQSLSQGRGDPIVHRSQGGEGADIVDLQAGGFPPRPEPPQSLTIRERKPIVGGHAKLSFHELETDTHWAVGMTGEPKAVTVTTDALYIASYPGALIQRYDFNEEEPTVVKQIGAEQNRPRDIAFHQQRETIFVGTHPVEGFLGGALAEYSPGTDSITVDRPIIENHSVSTVLPAGNQLIIGTEIPTGHQYRSTDLPDSAVLTGWDPDDRTTTWELTPVAGASTFRSLCFLDGLVYGLCPDGTIFEVDPSQPTVNRTLSVTESDGSLVVLNDQLYGVNTSNLYRVDRREWTTTTLVTDLNGHWFNWPMVTTNGEGLFTLRETDLIEIRIDD